MESEDQELDNLDERIIAAIRTGGNDDLHRLLDQKDRAKRDTLINRAQRLREKLAEAISSRAQAKQELESLQPELIKAAQSWQVAQDAVMKAFEFHGGLQIKAYSLDVADKTYFETISRFKLQLTGLTEQILKVR